MITNGRILSLPHSEDLSLPVASGQPRVGAGACLCCVLLSLILCAGIGDILSPTFIAVVHKQNKDK